MNLNLFKQSNNEKISYINLLCRCCFALIICAICLFPSIANATGTGSDGIEVPPPPTGNPNSGGGSTRGGGAGRTSYGTNQFNLRLTRGFTSLLTNGKMQVSEVLTSPYYVGWLPLSPNVTAKAETLTISGMYIQGSKMFFEFYNWNGTRWTRLGTTTYITGGLNVEIPKLTTAIKVVSMYNGGSGNLQYMYLKKADSEDLANTLQPEYTKNYLGNIWSNGLTVGTGSSQKGELYSYSSIASINYFPVSVGDVIKLTNNSPIGLYAGYAFYDSSFKWVSNTQTTGLGIGNSFTHNVTNSNIAYVRIWFDGANWAEERLSMLGDSITITGLNYEAESVAFQTDNSSISPFVNNYSYVTNVSNIEYGDGNVIVIGDNNDIEIGKPSETVVPKETVTVPNDSPNNGGGDDDNGDDDDKSFWDIIGDMFGGIGEALKGLLKIVMMPLDFIISAINELVGLLNSTLTATAGLGEFMTGMFGWLPSPLPSLLVTFMSGLIVVAFIKFLRG